MPNHALGLFIRCAQGVRNASRNSAKKLGLFTHYLPTMPMGVSKWVGLFQFNPHVYSPFSSTHILLFSPVKKQLYTLSTPPIKSSHYINWNKKGDFRP